MTEIDELRRMLDEFEHECYMLRVEASETRAKDEVVREAYERIRNESAQAIAATLGVRKLTAEQVEKAIRDCSSYASYDGLKYYASGINLQAIADELNATLNTRAERTCECVAEYAKSPIDGKTIVLHRCSACRELMRPHMAYCPNCGRKVKR